MKNLMNSKEMRDFVMRMSHQGLLKQKVVDIEVVKREGEIREREKQNREESEVKKRPRVTCKKNQE